MSHDRAKALLERTLGAELLSRAEDAELRTHLGACAECRALYDRQVEIERVLSGRTTPRAQEERLLARGAPVDVAPRVAPDGGGAPVVPLRRRVLAWAAPIAVAAGLLFALALRTPGDAPEGLRARGTTASAGRGAWMSVFTRPAGSTEIVPLGAQIRRRDALFFAYTSLREGGHGFVAIAGLDAAGRAHWYYPAWRDAREAPKSLAIERGADVELPEEIVADAAPGALEICALFSDAPLDVRDVDATLERERRWPVVPQKDCVRVEVVE
ncbi:hypothetical protein L6R52_33345 [Myxococcota bacterium]|nr:hypothetical protein [Myxococcota bacterium]